MSDKLFIIEEVGSKKLADTPADNEEPPGVAFPACVVLNSDQVAKRACQCPGSPLIPGSLLYHLSDCNSRL
jgi:hypothetical protein